MGLNNKVWIDFGMGGGLGRGEQWEKLRTTVTEQQ